MNSHQIAQPAEVRLNEVDNKLKNKFKRHIAHQCSLASNNIRSERFDIDDAKIMTTEGLDALRSQDGLKTMLAAQMLSIHELQQISMVYANAIDSMELKQYYTNTAIKLANCFVQQASVLSKLQGVGQKMVVERVDVHHGGQAIVGTIQGIMEPSDEKIKSTS